MMPGMVIDMDEVKLHTVAQVKAFLAGTPDLALTVPKAEHYGFIERVLKRFGYPPLSRPDKGVVLRYLVRMTGLSRQQVTRLVQRYRQHGRVVKRYRPPTHGFPRRFDATDTALLAEMDALHRTLSGPATKKLMERAFLVFGEARFARLAEISVSHLYNLRGGRRIGTHGGIGRRRARPGSPLDNAAPHSRRERQASSALTVCIKAIRTGRKGCITSMRWTV